MVAARWRCVVVIATLPMRHYNTSIYDAITKSEGKHVRLYYKEVMKHFFWQSETPYLIEKVEVVN